MFAKPIVMGLPDAACAEPVAAGTDEPFVPADVLAAPVGLADELLPLEPQAAIAITIAEDATHAPMRLNLIVLMHPGDRSEHQDNEAQLEQSLAVAMGGSNKKRRRPRRGLASGLGSGIGPRNQQTPAGDQEQCGSSQ